IFAVSCAVLTGPRSVTWPLAVMILMFFAVIESSLSFISACRIACVIFKSAGLFDWSPDVWVSPERSRSFVAVLSGFAFSLSAANAARLSALRQAKVSKVRFMGPFVRVCGGVSTTDRNSYPRRSCLLSCLLFSRDVDHGFSQLGSLLVGV